MQSFDYWNKRILNLTPQQFEELCWDLVKTLGYVNPKWVGLGGSDKGKDIVAEKHDRIGTSLVVDIQKVAFQCKRYSTGISQQDISSSIDWCDIEGYDRLFILSNSHLTEPARTYVEDANKKKKVKTLDICEKSFQDLLFSNKPILQTFFPEDAIPQPSIQSDSVQKILDIKIALPINLKDEIEKGIKEINELPKDKQLPAFFSFIEQNIITKIQEANIKALIYQQLSAYTSDPIQALSFIDKSLKITPKNSNALLIKAYILTRDNQYNMANETLDGVLAIDSQNKFAWNNSGHIHTQLGSYKQAEICFNRALNIDPDFIIARDNLGYILNLKGKHDEAITLYDKTLQLFPNSENTLIKKTDALIDKRDFKAAFEVTELILKNNPNSIGALNNKGVIIERCSNYLGDDKEKRKHYLNTALELFKKTTDIEKEFIRGYTNQAVVLINLTELDKAKEKIETVSKKYPNDLVAFDKQIEINLLEGKIDEAKEILNKGLIIMPESKDLLIQKCKILLNEKQFKKSLNLVDNLLRKNPHDSRLWRIKSDIYNAKADIKQRDKAYKKAIEYNAPLSVIEL